MPRSLTYTNLELSWNFVYLVEAYMHSYLFKPWITNSTYWLLLSLRACIFCISVSDSNTRQRKKSLPMRISLCRLSLQCHQINLVVRVWKMHGFQRTGGQKGQKPTFFFPLLHASRLARPHFTHHIQFD